MSESCKILRTSSLALLGAAICFVGFTEVKWRSEKKMAEQRQVDWDEGANSILGAHQYLLEGDGYRGLTAVLPRSTGNGERGPV
jgi:hypothetical protein